jgi:probable HAF family extracellular repeat protein
MMDLGTLGGDYSAAFGISEEGHVVGASLTSGADGPETHAFLWAEGDMIDLGTLGGTYSGASAITPTGSQVVGASTRSDDEQFRATLWTRQ